MVRISTNDKCVYSIRIHYFPRLDLVYYELWRFRLLHSGLRHFIISYVTGRVQKTSCLNLYFYLEGSVTRRNDKVWNYPVLTFSSTVQYKLRESQLAVNNIEGSLKFTTHLLIKLSISELVELAARTTWSFYIISDKLGSCRFSLLLH